jgi:hypothetical protein
MTTQTPSEFIAALTTAADANAQTKLRKNARGGRSGEGKAEAKLPDGRTVACTYSYSTSLYGRDVVRSSFTIDGKRASKEQISVALGGRTKTMVAEMNPQLRATFEAQAPQLARDYRDYVLRLYTRAYDHFEGKIPCWVKYDNPWRYEITVLFRDVCDTINTHDKPINPTHIYVLNEKTLNEKSEKYGDEVAVQWFYKTNEKLGKLEDATLVNDSQGDVVVSGIRDGKKVVLNQQRILKRSKNGVLFHQFPARLYVDGKFTTEAAYKKLFGDKE